MNNAVVAVIFVALINLSAVTNAEDYIIDFNTVDLTVDFDLTHDNFVIESYQNPLDSFRGNSDKFLTNNYTGMWGCLTSKSLFTVDRDATLSLAVNLTSPPGQSVSRVQIEILDTDSGTKQRLIDSGPTNQWKVLYNTSDKKVQNAKILIWAYVLSGSSLAIDYVDIINPKPATEPTQAPTEASSETSSEETSTKAPTEIIVDKNWNGTFNGSILFKLVFSLSNSKAE